MNKDFRCNLLRPQSTAFTHQPAPALPVSPSLDSWDFSDDIPSEGKQIPIKHMQVNSLKHLVPSTLKEYKEPSTGHLSDMSTTEVESLNGKTETPQSEKSTLVPRFTPPTPLRDFCSKTSSNLLEPVKVLGA